MSLNRTFKVFFKQNGFSSFQKMLYFTSKISMHLLEKMALCKRNPIVTKEPQNENYKIQRSLRKNRFINTYSFITTLIQMNYRMSCSALIFFLYIKKQLRKRKL